MSSHHSCIKGFLANKDKHRPRVVMLGFSWEQRTSQEAVCVPRRVFVKGGLPYSGVNLIPAFRITQTCCTPLLPTTRHAFLTAVQGLLEIKHTHHPRVIQYRGTSLIRNCLILGPYSRTMPMALRWSWGGGSFL